MATTTPGLCQHPDNFISWRGTNGYAWKWTCEQSGMTQTIKKVPGQPRPTPGQPIEENFNNDETAGFNVPSMLDETLVGSAEEWELLSSLLHRMVGNHTWYYMEQ